MKNLKRIIPGFSGSKLSKNINLPTILIYFNNRAFTIFRPFCFLFFLALLFFGSIFPAFPQEKTSIRKVVIDAGHGGKDPGAIGRKTQEKHVTLAIALKLGSLIEAGFKDVDVIYTRDTDVFVELYQRAEIANKNKADLFISIHCNANKSKVYEGVETYVMGLHKSEQNLEISKLENASILMEPDYLTRYDGFDPNSDESYITFTLFQNAYLRQSTEFAAEVQNAMKDRVGMDDRGVRQAGFLVLYKTTMPSVLIETGFLSNPVEESYLISRVGQSHIADAIYRAFRSYKQKVEKTAPQDKPETPDQKNIIPDSKPVQPVVKNETAKKVPDKPSTGKEKIKPEEAGAQENEIWFTVQVATSPTDLGVDNPKFKNLKGVKVYRHEGMFKYIVGREKNMEAASKLLQQVKSKGFRDAFVVAFRGDERITIEQARKLLDKHAVE
jgi:N-acetylmuramoyl-L-alanine amidase